jgi:protein transport protein SEC24
MMGVAAPPPAPGFPGAPGGMPQAPEYPGSVYGAPPAHSLVGMPSAFDHYGSGGGASMGGVPGAPGNMSTPTAVAGGVADPNSSNGGVGAGGQLPSIDEMDLSIQCNPMFLRSSVSKIVSSQALATSSKVPIGLICRPMAGDVGTENEQVEVVDFGSTGIIRCKRCRTYINPFVSWTDSGRRWR